MNLKRERKDHALVLAWPETMCKQAGAWYDPMMRLFNVNKDGYYKVGHSALVLISHNTNSCEYFDFGRYHAPPGCGRVRSEVTDHDLKINTRPIFDDENELVNEQKILDEICMNPSCHGSGYLLSSYVPVNLGTAKKMVLQLIRRQFISYGPFLTDGTNCSRFVARVLLAANIPIVDRLKLFFQPLSPRPKGNVLAMSSPTKVTGATKSTEVFDLYGMPEVSVVWADR